jgi:16S rRNA (cytosine1402-N4)-methyltransferase
VSQGELPPSERPKRRPRYSGKNPRRFEEKYKELNPEKYADTVAKVIASGKTPAGSHRPIMVAEILEVLKPQPGEIAVDCTLGYGGHAEEILKRIQPYGRLIGLDVDPFELPRTTERLASFSPSFIPIQSNFAGLQKVLASQNLEGANLILADLGVSSMQYDRPERGFTYKHDGPLDMRLNPNKGQPASALLANLSADRIAQVLTENADEPHARRIAEAIVAHRGTLQKTTHLATLIRKTVPDSEADASLRRVFQAIRIAVNDEFGALESFLRILPTCLLPAARVAILTFHSGEDRRVKHAFKEYQQSEIFSEISEEVIRPTPEELHSNPRSSPAKLRWAIRA